MVKKTQRRRCTRRSSRRRVSTHKRKIAQRAGGFLSWIMNPFGSSKTDEEVVAENITAQSENAAIKEAVVQASENEAINEAVAQNAQNRLKKNMNRIISEGKIQKLNPNAAPYVPGNSV